MQSPVAFDGESRHPAVDQRDGSRLEYATVDRHILLDGDLCVTEVADQRVHGSVTGDDEHRQRRCPAQVGVGLPHLAEAALGRHEHPGRTVFGELPLEFDAEARVGGGQPRR